MATSPTIIGRATQEQALEERGLIRSQMRLGTGLIAFGAGMVISSLIPSSQKEQDAVSNLQGNLEPLKEKATEVAKDFGQQLKEPAQQAAESVKSTAAEGVQNVKDEGVAAKDQVQGQAQESKATVQDQVR